MGRNNSTLAIFLLGVGLTLAGCAARQKAVTGLPAGVTETQAQNWDTAIANLDKIAQTVSTLRQTVIALNGVTVTDSQATHKVIPDGATYAAILTGIGRVDQAQLDAVTYLKAQPQNWNATTQAKVKNDVTLIRAELQAIVSQQLVGIKNPNAQQQVQALITQLGTAAAAILALVG